MLTQKYESPCGDLLLGVVGNKLVLCDWMIDNRIERTLSRIEKYLPKEGEDNSELMDSAIRRLSEYFSGDRAEFDLPLKTFGTEFQKDIWESLNKVAYGKTASYQSIAEAMGQNRSARAVANAIGANAISIIIPCHRIVGSDGTLKGYAGGREAKKYLLDLEKREIMASSKSQGREIALTFFSK